MKQWPPIPESVPWKWSGDTLKDAGGTEILTACQDSWGDARLIVKDEHRPLIEAAPELLYALKQAERLALASGYDGQEIRRWRSLINRAEGKR